MFSSEKFFLPSQINQEFVAMGFVTFDSQDKPLFRIPGNAFITEIKIFGNPFTLDGAPSSEVNQALTLGVIGDSTRFLEAVNGFVNANPIYVWFTPGDALFGDLGAGVTFDEFYLSDTTIITGSYTPGDGGANGGGPLWIIMSYILL